MDTPEGRAAYVHAMATSALIRAMGMQAENAQRAALGQSMAFTEEAFAALIEEYGIHHNAVVTTLNG